MWGGSVDACTGGQYAPLSALTCLLHVNYTSRPGELRLSLSGLASLKAGRLLLMVPFSPSLPGLFLAFSITDLLLVSRLCPSARHHHSFFFL